MNPKELAFGAGAGLVFGGTLTEWWPSFFTVALFALFASLTTAVPVVVALFCGAGAAAALAETRTWLVRNNATITRVVLLLFGRILLSTAFE